MYKYKQSPYLNGFLLSILLLIACDEKDKPTQIDQYDMQVHDIDIHDVAVDDAQVYDAQGYDQSILSQIPVDLMYSGILADQFDINITNTPNFKITIKNRNDANAKVISIQGSELGIGWEEDQNFDRNVNYDPYLLYFSGLGLLKPIPTPVNWHGIVGMLSYQNLDFSAQNTTTNDSQDTSASQNGATLPSAMISDQAQGLGIECDVLFDHGQTAKLRISKSSENGVFISIAPTIQPHYFFFEQAIEAQENFYGMGEHFDQVARRNTYQSSIFQLLPKSESKYNEMHVPVPLLISTLGYGFFLQNMEPAFFDIDYFREDRLRIELGNAKTFRLHLLQNSKPFDALKSYYDITGSPLIPPYWGFAPHFWRNETTGQSEVLSDLDQIRSLNIPAGVFWIDRPYEQFYNDCIFDPNRYQNPREMGDMIKQKGFKLMLWHAPYTKEESDAWQDCNTQHAFVEGPQVFLNFGRLMDFTNPKAFDIWQNLLNRFNETVDVAGYKLDYAEDIQVAVGRQRLNFSFADGSNELTMHHGYALHYYRTYLNSLDDFTNDPTGVLKQRHFKNGLIMGRSSTFGGQRLTHALWPGDLDSDFRTHLEDGIWVGGLPASIVANLSLSASGFPFFASDTGGFRNGRPTQDVLIRWAWQTALSPIMQIGGGGSSHFPWAQAQADEPPYDQFGIDTIRQATSLHLRLADYRYTWALATVNGQPLTRPFGMAYPTDGRHPNDVYLLGPDLLVAPIISDQNQRSVPLPSGVWKDYWTHQTFIGPTDISVMQDLTGIPLYIRKGAIIPFLDPNIMSLESIAPEHRMNGTFGRKDQAGLLTFLIYHENDQSYTNHDGTKVSLSDHAILIEPASSNDQLLELPIFEQFEIEFLLEDGEMPSFRLNEIAMPLVDREAFHADCGCVYLDQQLLLAKIALPRHLGESQLIEWDYQ